MLCKFQFFLKDSKFVYVAELFVLHLLFFALKVAARCVFVKNVVVRVRLEVFQTISQICEIFYDFRSNSYFYYLFVLCCCFYDFHYVSVDFGSRCGCPALFIKLSFLLTGLNFFQLFHRFRV